MSDTSRLFADRNFRLLGVAQLLSTAGDFAMLLVLGIWAKELTGSSGDAGLVFLFLSAPALAGPALGVFVDRFPRRAILITVDLATAAAVLLLLLVNDAGRLSLLYAVALLYGFSAQIYGSAKSGLLVTMLDEELLAQANGVLGSISQGVRLTAPLLGAGLYALAGGHAVAIMDAGTFVISAALLSRLRSDDLVRPPVRRGFMAELIEGLQTVWRIRVVRRLVVVTAVVMAAAGMTEVGVFSLIAEGLHEPPAFLGVLAAVQGLTSVVTGLTAGFIVRRVGELRVAAFAALAFAAAFGLAGLFPTLPVAFFAAAMGGVGNTAYFVAMTTLIQRSVTVELQGRVMSTSEAVVNLPYVLSIALGAVVVDAVGFAPIFEASAAILTIGAVFLAAGRPEDALVTEAAIPLPSAGQGGTDRLGRG